MNSTPTANQATDAPIARPLRQPRAEHLGAVASLAAHWPEYLMEASELGLFMVSACVFTLLLEHPASPARAALPNEFLRHVLAGLAMAATAIAIFYSSWGKQSGAHMNPATTLTFLRLRKIAPWDALFYILSQFIGGIGGVALSYLMIGSALTHRNVHFAVTAPGPRGIRVAFVAEAAISFLLLLTVLFVSNNKNLSKFTPLFAGTLIATYISLESPLSGMSMNPARTFGSAFLAGDFTALWLYFLAPPVGMLLAAELYVRLRGAQKVYCAKYHHANSKRCIFLCRYGDLANS